jgi:hypothetical protein
VGIDVDAVAAWVGCEFGGICETVLVSLQFGHARYGLVSAKAGTIKIATRVANEAKPSPSNFIE